MNFTLLRLRHQPPTDFARETHRLWLACIFFNIASVARSTFAAARGLA